MIGRVVSVVGAMPDTTYTVSVSIGGSLGTVPAAVLYRPPANKYKVAPFEVGDSVACEMWPEGADTQLCYITTPEPLDVEACP